MSEPRRALVLHLSSGADPLLVAISADRAEELSRKLPELLRRADFETIEAANGSAITVNFGQVLAAHIDISPPLGAIWGAPQRERAGLGS
ncbi:MAG TPA: hypothetical protein VG756_28180 [Pseudonocardiaceae bacterium]|jgi:hypothetical protein|nr:hypothetical protein [Pseudonocardiaceae bacterium]